MAESHLPTLLAGLRPHLDPLEYVYVALPDMRRAAELAPLALFCEEEAVTHVLPRTVAEANGLDYTYPCRRITLTVDSALEAVGMLAAITTRLAAAGISVNPFAAYHHDHLFVPADAARKAMAVLESFAEGG